MEYLEAYEDFYRGQKAVVLAGGPSTPKDFFTTPRDSILIGVNAHGVLLPDLDYIYYLDDITEQYIDFHHAKKISKKKKDGYIFAGIIPAMGMGGSEAIYCADYMGFSEIYCCGYDGYRGNSHWHMNVDSKRTLHFSYQKHLDAYATLKGRLRRPENIKFFNPDIVEIFEGKA